MSLVISEADKEQMLSSILPEGGQYIAGGWATIMGGTIAVLALGALSNTYCYIGVTDRHFCLAVTGTLKVNKMIGQYVVSYDELTKLKISGSLIPKQKRLVLKTKDGSKLKIAINCYNFGSSIKDQAGNAKKILEILKQYER